MSFPLLFCCDFPCSFIIEIFKFTFFISSLSLLSLSLSPQTSSCQGICFHQFSPHTVPYSSAPCPLTTINSHNKFCWFMSYQKYGWKCLFNQSLTLVTSFENTYGIEKFKQINFSILIRHSWIKYWTPLPPPPFILSVTSSTHGNHIYQPLRLGRIWHKVNF